MLKPSELKTDIEGFNNLPERKEIEDFITRESLPVVFVDWEEKPYWKNEYDTMVFKIENHNNRSVADGLRIGDFALQFAVDEFFFDFVDGELIIRLWWD